MKGAVWTSLALLVFAWMTTLVGGHAHKCGRQVGGKLCHDHLCCSEWGYCGYTPSYCGEGCQSQCVQPPPPPAEPLPPVPPGGGAVGEIISKELFEKLLPHRNDDICPGKGFYTYEAFIAAAYYTFPDFGAKGNLETRTREIAAFLAQTSHETTGGWPKAPGGPHAWGYCFVKEGNTGCCVANAQWPCVPGKSYCGRGPIQLTYNYNYGPAGEAIGEDLLNDPDKVAYDPYVSFQTALWFWMTPQQPKPSCHDVIIGKWKRTHEDKAARRKPGFGVLTNIINGGLECGHGQDERAANRVGYYKHFCEILGISPGHHLDCDHQGPFGLTAAIEGRSAM